MSTESTRGGLSVSTDGYDLQRTADWVLTCALPSASSSDHATGLQASCRESSISLSRDRVSSKANSRKSVGSGSASPEGQALASLARRISGFHKQNYPQYLHGGYASSRGSSHLSQVSAMQGLVMDLGAASDELLKNPPPPAESPVRPSHETEVRRRTSAVSSRGSLPFRTDAGVSHGVGSLFPGASGAGAVSDRRRSSNAAGLKKNAGLDSNGSPSARSGGGAVRDRSRTGSGLGDLLAQVRAMNAGLNLEIHQIRQSEESLALSGSPDRPLYEDEQETVSPFQQQVSFESGQPTLYDSSSTVHRNRLDRNWGAAAINAQQIVQTGSWSERNDTSMERWPPRRAKTESQRPTYDPPDSHPRSRSEQGKTDVYGSHILGDELTGVLSSMRDTQTKLRQWLEKPATNASAWAGSPAAASLPVFDAACASLEHLYELSAAAGSHSGSASGGADLSLAAAIDQVSLLAHHMESLLASTKSWLRTAEVPQFGSLREDRAMRGLLAHFESGCEGLERCLNASHEVLGTIAEGSLVGAHSKKGAAVGSGQKGGGSGDVSGRVVRFLLPVKGAQGIAAWPQETGVVCRVDDDELQVKILRTGEATRVPLRAVSLVRLPHDGEAIVLRHAIPSGALHLTETFHSMPVGSPGVALRCDRVGSDVLLIARFSAQIVQIPLWCVDLVEP
ncbi:hypothetical protein DIPPA_23366 [Diplonema papillatum]|nr:hypothetical protein DIPPA_23366 [Diplonema papillatum]